MVDDVNHSGFRLVATFVLIVPFAAAACSSDDDATPGSGGAAAGKGGSQSAAGSGGRGGTQSENGGTGALDLLGGAGGTDACVPVSGTTNGNGVIEPLGDACSRFTCPASVADAAKKTHDYCGNTFAPRITYGCGTVTVDYSDFSGGTAYTFDATTNEVVLLRRGNDTPFGACDVSQYFYGELPASCPDEITCYPCDDLRNEQTGAAGAAGETGSAGAAGRGSVSPPRCPQF